MRRGFFSGHWGGGGGGYFKGLFKDFLSLFGFIWPSRPYEDGWATLIVPKGLIKAYI